jgi:excisionase family DNA binding protein
MNDRRSKSQRVVRSPAGRPAIALDDETRRVLRALGETALRLADGRDLDTSQPAYDPPAVQTTVDDNGLLTVTEVCARLRISRWGFYRLLHQNELRSITIGRRRLVPHTELNRFLAALNEKVVSV